MLWMKDDSDEKYIDLIKNVNYSSSRRRMYLDKNSKISERVRLEGNKRYSEGDFQGSLIKYNESICLAVDKTSLSLAFANRSLCFLKLCSYNQCLIDIQLAKDAGYPVTLMDKLDSRKAECLKKMALPDWKESAASFEAVEISGLSDCVEIQDDNVYGRFMTAKRDVEIGETILIERSYIRIVTGDCYNECTGCGKKSMNFIPCKNCAKTMYCDDKCSRNNFHESECDMTIATLDDDGWLAYTIRSVVIGINTFKTIDEMMQFVSNNVATNSREVADYCDSPKSKYRMFFKLESVVSHERILGYRQNAYFIYDSIVNSTKLGKKFQTITTQRFLMHLIVHHHFILRTNSFGYVEKQANVHELALYSSYLNHSCLRNTAKLSKGNISVCKTILPIRRGEQFFLKYLAGEVFGMTEEERNDQLTKSYNFRCTCNLCTIGSLEANFLENDPSFVYIATNVNKVNEIYDCDIIRNLIRRCLTFLRQHSNMVGSQELHYIADTLAGLYSIELNVD